MIKSFNLIIYFELVEDFSILLANRSAALYRMEKFDLALQDIELAEESYPKEMMHKLKERAARCYLAKKCYEQALEAFKFVFISFAQVFFFCCCF